MHRRELLKTAAGLAAWSGFWNARAEAREQTDQTRSASGPRETRKGDMLYRTFGQTGEQVSALGLGGYHIGTIKDEQEAIRVMRTAIDRGVNFFDNCWAYHNGKSEVWMGKALKDGYRDKVFLMTKFEGRTKQAAARHIDESLKRLDVDHVDLLQCHEVIRLEDPWRYFNDGAVEAVEAARKAGKVRFVGFTGHKDPVVHNRMLDVAAQNNYRFDAVQMPINVLDASFHSFAGEVLPRLIEQGIASLAMKTMASGAIVRNNLASVEECLTYALTLPNTTVISGMESMAQLEQNLKIVKDFRPLPEAAMKALLTRVAKPARTGEYEKFKTTQHFDATARHPEWLG